jgi:hypothetical protein
VTDGRRARGPAEEAGGSGWCRGGGGGHTRCAGDIKVRAFEDGLPNARERTGFKAGAGVWKPYTCDYTMQQ